MQASQTETVIDVAPDGRILSTSAPGFVSGRSWLSRPGALLVGAATLLLASLALMAWVAITLLPVVAMVGLCVWLVRRFLPARPRAVRPATMWAPRRWT